MTGKSRGAHGQTRTGTPLAQHGILSPGRLPIPPRGHDDRYNQVEQRL